jgi:DNA polymerase-3 subunit delta
VGGKAYDSFLAEEALASLLAREVGEGRPDTVQVLRGDETSWSRIVDSARTGSLFAERRALVVRGADALKGEGEEMIAYLREPNPDVALVLMAVRPDRRRAVWKKTLEQAAVVAAEPLRGRALRTWVQDRLRRRKLKVAEEALDDLIERFGQDLRRLMGEVEKLEAFTDGGRTVTADDVAAVTGHGLAQPLYLLGDAVTERNPGRALELIEALLDEGEEATLILAAIHRSLRQVRRTIVLKDAGLRREVLAARLLPPNMAFKLPALLEAARRWTESDLRKGVAVLAEADRGMKTGAEVRSTLAAAVVGACGRPAAASRGARPGR